MRPWLGVVAAAIGVALLTHACVAVESDWLHVPAGLLLLGFGVYEIRRADTLALLDPPPPVEPFEQAPAWMRATRGAQQGVRFVELTDLPIPYDYAFPVVFGGHNVHVIYRTDGCDCPPRDGFAVVEFALGRRLHDDSYDDEQLHRHPLFALGLMYYRIQEVIGSAERRHFVFALKEGSFDCIASSYRLVGEYPTMAEAEAVVSELRAQRP